MSNVVSLDYCCRLTFCCFYHRGVSCCSGLEADKSVVRQEACLVAMMNDLPDVAGSLFTNQYKAVKIEGKKLKPNALEGTGSVSGLC